jgi:hypothetical protein
MGRKEGKARQGKARQGKARQGKARPGKGKTQWNFSNTETVKKKIVKEGLTNGREKKEREGHCNNIEKAE